MPDTEANTDRIVSQMRGNRPKTVVSGIAAARLHLDAAGQQIEFVVEDDDVAFRDLEKAGRVPYALSALVHERFGLEKQNFLAADFSIGRIAFELLLPENGFYFLSPAMFFHFPYNISRDYPVIYQ